MRGIIVMSEKKLLFSELERKDEFGKSKAVCAITIQHILSSDQVEIMDSVSTMEAQISVYADSVWTIVDLKLEDDLNYDFIQAAQLCKKYLELVRASMEELALVLTVTSLGNYDYFITGVNGAWSHHTEELYERSNVLRLMFVKECFWGYHEDMEEIIEETAMEFSERKLYVSRKLIPAIKEVGGSDKECIDFLRENTLRILGTEDNCS